MWKLFRGHIVRCDRPPASAIPMRNPTGGVASHALPGTVLAPSLPLLPALESHACGSKAA
jgi:hypothetical protein